MHARNPYTGEQDYQFESATADNVRQVSMRLRAGQVLWAALGLRERIEVLDTFSVALQGQRKALIAALTLDTGRTQVAALEVDSLLGFIQRTAATAPRVLANHEPIAAQIPIIEGRNNRFPLGLVGNISPWNFPIILSFLDTFPALVAGNAVLIKPSEVTPRWVAPMRAAIKACPEIAAVLDIVEGDGSVGAELVKNVDAIVFTGSVPTGRKVAEAAAKNFIPAFLELGGKDPAVVLASADVALAAKTTTFCSVQSAGQACQSLERIYVHESIAEEFTRTAIATAKSLAINYPDISGGPVGPFIFEQQAHLVKAQLDDAVAKGARIETGGEIIDHGGLWMAPTVVTNVSHDMLLMQEETFGPVMPIMSFRDESEALRLANDSHYGLSAAVFAGTADEAEMFSRKIKAGAISINDAALTVLIHDFEHDAFGYSGLGRSRSGASAYTRFTREQSIMINTQAQPLLLGQLGK